MDPTLTWLLVIAAAALIVFSAMRFDVLAASWRSLIGDPPAPREAPPSPRWKNTAGFTPHEAPAHKPAFHRSGGRRH